VKKEISLKELLKKEQLKRKKEMKMKFLLMDGDGSSKKTVHMTNTNMRW
jgi:hypothetical protein